MSIISTVIDNYNLFYYTVSLLNKPLPALTYESELELQAGAQVEVKLRNRDVVAVILQAVTKPDFKTTSVLLASNKHFSSQQIQTAKFISNYYMCSLGEALNLFVPFASAQCSEENEKLDMKNEEEVESKIFLSTSQDSALSFLQKHPVSLLFGDTGSGKTEIYMKWFEQVLAEGKRVLFLMPEISLTPQMEIRLKEHFGEAVVMWHSKVTKPQKEKLLQKIYDGSAKIIAGARSALFLPIDDLGLIVVDEEHDDSYKANARPRYHARDVAVLMGQKLGAKVVLASATPSTTSYYKYDVVRLPKPYVQTQKRYRFIPGDGITAPIVYAIREHYEEGGQSLLFLPTRGNFKYLYCQNCGKTHTCPYCSVGMALHRKRRHLKCHYCNYTEAIRESCTYCGHTPLSSERIGTQEAIEVIEEAIEGIKIEQFDRDSITTANKLVKALKRFESGESHLLLGTQMLSKGHDYPNITLAVIMGLDHIMGMADYRSRERAMSLLFQIAGRSGRAKQAEVLIQTADPAQFEPYLGNYEQFLKDELLFLEIAEYPPFVSLARILIAHKDEAKAAKVTMDTVTKLKAFAQIEIVGHGKAPVERIANKYRFQILLRAKNRVPLLKALHAVDCREIEVDMDPVEFS